MTLQERLREHRVILKSGDYDGAQLMAAWCDMVNAAAALDAQAERIKALERALNQPVRLSEWQELQADRDEWKRKAERCIYPECCGIAAKGEA